jgi:nicotinamidase-related amidase
MNTALLLIDYQNDYFPEGKYPLWNTKGLVAHTLKLIDYAKENEFKIFFVQHISPVDAPFFCENSYGAEIHIAFKAALETSIVIQKRYTSSFRHTNLKQHLNTFCIDRILLAGAMTQNCVGHTAIAPEAKQYNPIVIGDCCTSSDPIIHKVGLNTISQYSVPILSLNGFIDNTPF